MQLVAYGAQDIYLTGNPQITFFKVVYRRHTNFSMESIQQTWAGTLDKKNAGRVTATIARNGDLVGRLYLVSKSPTFSPSANLLAQAIDTVECEIGGQTIDRQYGHWMEAWAELTEPNPSGFVGDLDDGERTSKGTNFQIMAQLGNNLNGNYPGRGGDTEQEFSCPLRFWFCENPGLALPLIALQYHEVKIILSGKGVAQTEGADRNGNMHLWADYIYLDTDERRRFAQVSHEYLITQIQYQNFSTDNKTCTLTFNHPVKELVWTGAWGGNLGEGWGGSPTASEKTDRRGKFQALKAGSKYQIKLNGHDRFAARDRNYFTVSQIWQYHTGFGNAAATNVNGHGVAVYSFALKPEEHQPSGTCNFSRIDNAQLVTTNCSGNDTATLPNNIYAVNYNVLRIMSGMGGLAYSN